MAKENSQKIKLLKLMELLRQETDEQHPMAATVVCQKLNDMEVACDRRTLTRDINDGSIMDADDSTILKQLVEQIIVGTSGIEIQFKCGVSIEKDYE